MKKAVYQGLYQLCLSLTNHFNSRFIVKCKILLGTALIVLTSSCSKEDDEPEIMCYDPAPPKETDMTCYSMVSPKETAETRPVTTSFSAETVHFVEKI